MARTNRSGLTPSVIETLRNRINPETGEKYKQVEIARMYDVTPAYVSWVKHNHNTQLKPRERMRRDHWPWRIERGQWDASPAKRLSDHLEYVATQGKDMSDTKLYNLRNFYNRIENDCVVVEYDPDIPPSDGVFTGGWAYRPRLESDGLLIIRQNQHCRELTAADRKVWQLPARRP